MSKTPQELRDAAVDILLGLAVGGPLDGRLAVAKELFHIASVETDRESWKTDETVTVEVAP